MKPLHQSTLPHLKLLFRGKVRDIYDCGEELLLVATDRLSAYDVVFPDPIPGKGELLTQMSLFWFEMMKPIVPNHISSNSVSSVLKTDEQNELYGKRSMLVKKTKPLTIEAVARGYIVGSGWKDYQKTGAVCGIKLPSGLQEAQKLPEPIFTPATKAPQGDHDENISFDYAVNEIGKENAELVKELTLRIYSKGADYAETKDIILADTKLEFGIWKDELILIDEVLTPDSSRFWPKNQYQVGMSPPSFDKQFVRDYVSSVGWDKKAPAPKLPEEVIKKTSEKYQEALTRLAS